MPYVNIEAFTRNFMQHANWTTIQDVSTWGLHQPNNWRRPPGQNILSCCLTFMLQLIYIHGWCNNEPVQYHVLCCYYWIKFASCQVLFLLYNNLYIYASGNALLSRFIDPHIIIVYIHIADNVTPSHAFYSQWGIPCTNVMSMWPF